MEQLNELWCQYRTYKKNSHATVSLKVKEYNSASEQPSQNTTNRNKERLHTPTDITTPSGDDCKESCEGNRQTESFTHPNNHTYAMLEGLGSPLKRHKAQSVATRKMRNPHGKAKRFSNVTHAYDTPALDTENRFKLSVPAPLALVLAQKATAMTMLC